MNPPILNTLTMATATTTSGSYLIDMQPGGQASLQLNATWDTSDTSTITLAISNDGVNFVSFATSKTLSVSGNTYGLFELGQIDYRYLQVSWTAPSTYHLTLIGYLYQIPTITQELS